MRIKTPCCLYFNTNYRVNLRVCCLPTSRWKQIQPLDWDVRQKNVHTSKKKKKSVYTQWNGSRRKRSNQSKRIVRYNKRAKKCCKYVRLRMTFIRRNVAILKVVRMSFYFGLSWGFSRRKELWSWCEEDMDCLLVLDTIKRLKATYSAFWAKISGRNNRNENKEEGEREIL